MSSETKPQVITTSSPKPQAAPVFDKAVASKHLKDVKDYLLTFEGKKGFNPHFQIVKMDKYEKALASKDPLSESDFNAIMAFKKEEPTV